MNTPLINGRANQITDSPMNFGKSPMIDSSQRRRVKDQIIRPMFEKPVNKQLPNDPIINEEEEKIESDIPIQNKKKAEGVKNLLKKMEI